MTKAAVLHVKPKQDMNWTSGANRQTAAWALARSTPWFAETLTRKQKRQVLIRLTSCSAICYNFCLLTLHWIHFHAPLQIQLLHRRMSEESQPAESLDWLSQGDHPAALAFLLNQAASSRCVHGLLNPHRQPLLARDATSLTWSYVTW